MTSYSIEIVYVPPTDLRPAGNPQTDRETLLTIAASLDLFGWILPVVARREDGLVLDGEKRVLANAFRHCPDDLIPVVYRDGIDDATATQLRAALRHL